MISAGLISSDIVRADRKLQELNSAVTLFMPNKNIGNNCLRFTYAYAGVCAEATT